MYRDDQPEHAMQEGITEGSFTDSVTSDASPAGDVKPAACDVEPACMALVPLVEAAQWSPRRPMPRPDAIFVTHLIATLEQAPQTRSQRRATASDANAAYTANRHRLAGGGLRARQTI